MTASNIAELAVPYAILALYDGQKPITAENIQTILQAANIEVEPIWTEVFARAFSDAKAVESLLNNISSAPVAVVSSAVPTSSAAPQTATGTSGKKEEKKETKPVEEEEEDISLSLFD